MTAVPFIHYEGEYAMAKLPLDASVPAAVFTGRMGAVIKTDDELTVICDTKNAPVGAQIDSGWACLKVLGPMAFDVVGVMGSLSGALAAAKISLIAVSTFDTDYVLVKRENIEGAVKALVNAGHDFKGQR